MKKILSTPVLIAFLTGCLGFLTSCTSTDEPNEINYLPKLKDLNKHLPLANKEYTENDPEYAFLGIADGAAYTGIMYVVPEEGSPVRYMDDRAIYELPASGATCTISFTERSTTDEKVKLLIFNDAADIVSAKPEPVTGFSKIVTQLYWATPSEEVVLQSGFKNNNNEKYGYAEEINVDMPYLEEEQPIKGTRYHFPVNTTGKPRIICFAIPDFRYPFLGADDKELCYDKYFFLQYAE